MPDITPTAAGQEPGGRLQCLRDGIALQRSANEVAAIVSELFPGPRTPPHRTTYEYRETHTVLLMTATDNLRERVAEASGCGDADEDWKEVQKWSEEIWESTHRLEAPPTFEQYQSLDDLSGRLSRAVADLGGLRGLG
jgi:hypothetical protein